MAVLDVDDPSFWEGTQELEFGDIPELQVSRREGERLRERQGEGGEEGGREGGRERVHAGARVG